MIGKTAHRGLTRATIWLMAVLLSFPSLAPASCGCGATLGGTSDDSCRSAKCPPPGGIGHIPCCQTSKNTRTCCCQKPVAATSSCSGSHTAGAGSSEGKCSCGGNCSCDRGPTPQPPAVPVGQEQSPREQIAAAQVELATVLPSDGAVDHGIVADEICEFVGPATSTERCTLLSRFTL